MCPVICSYGQSSPPGINAQLRQVMNIPIQMPLLKNWRDKGIWGISGYIFPLLIFKRAHQRFIK